MLCGESLLQRSVNLARIAVGVEALLVAGLASTVSGTTPFPSRSRTLPELLDELAAGSQAETLVLLLDASFPMLSSTSLGTLCERARVEVGRRVALRAGPNDLAALAVVVPLEASCAEMLLLDAPDGELRRVNDKRALVELESLAYRQRADDLLTRGLLVRDPASTRISGALSFGTDVVIEPGCTLEGPVVLGDRVRVGHGCLLRRASIGADTEIRPYTIVEEAEVAEGCFIGPYARLRPGTFVGARGQIGNFVEIKASRLGVSSRINHLSFVGDSTFDERVTIGAGTITCNHDGVRHQRTAIGAGAYVGSGCILVAPLTIGEGATIGAGSTLTSDAPAAKLSLARARQIVIENWPGFEARRK
jgi:acetyltransferase-like isoleucine patch superfamily enzyme